MAGRDLTEITERCHDAQVVPVKVYESSDRLTIAAPMPGLEPENICVEVTPGNQLVLHGDRRGSFKDENLVLVDEWNPGPYCRELPLPSPVDGTMANVTYGNGVLVVALPMAAVTHPAHLGLETVGPDHGERVGNAGHPVRRVIAAKHQHRRGGPPPLPTTNETHDAERSSL